MTAPKDQQWHETEIKDLIRMWHEGRPASDIAKAIGRTRNAVIGKVHRLDLERRPDPSKGKKQKAASSVPRAAKPKPARFWAKFKPKKITQPKEIVMPDSSKHVPLLEVSEYQCRAIVDYLDGQLGQAICCGEDVTVSKLPGRLGEPLSWCAYHASIYQEPPKPKGSRDARGSGPMAADRNRGGSASVQSNQEAPTKAA